MKHYQIHYIRCYCTRRSRSSRSANRRKYDSTDIFYALDASPANDASGDKTQFGQLGKGALLRIYDRTMVTHRGMREFILDTAETNNIPYQYFISQGGTDAGRVHTSNSYPISSNWCLCTLHSYTCFNFTC